jgi:hypothetical protein
VCPAPNLNSGSLPFRASELQSFQAAKLFPKLSSYQALELASFEAIKTLRFQKFDAPGAIGFPFSSNSQLGI